MTRTYKKYSEAIKKQVVAEYEQGSSISELNRKYGITGGETVKKWIKKYAKEGFRHKFIRIQTIDEINQVKALEKRRITSYNVCYTKLLRCNPAKEP